MNHSFDIDHAKQYGLHEAILIANFQFWIIKNKANGRHQYDGRTWTYNSARALADLMPYLSDRQIRRTLDNLVEIGVLVKGNYNPSAYDRTLWFAFADESKFQIGHIHSPNSANGKPEFGGSHTDINHIENTDSKHSSPAKPAGADVEAAFEVFWTAGMVKTGKKKALAAFASIVKNKHLDPNTFAEQLGVDVQARIKAKQFGFDKLHPTTYLNGERWNDAMPAANDNARGGKPSINDFGNGESAADDPFQSMRRSF